MGQQDESMTSSEGKRILLCDNQHLTLEIEYYPGAVFLHMIEVHNFNRETFRYIRKLANGLIDWLVPLYGVVYTYADKDRTDLARLARLTGFKAISTQDNWVLYERRK